MLFSATTNVYLTQEQQLKAVVTILQNDYNTVLNDATALMRKDNLEDFEAEDLEYDIQVMKSIIKLLEYYMEHSEFQEWISLYNFDVES